MKAKLKEKRLCDRCRKTEVKRFDTCNKCLLEIEHAITPKFNKNIYADSKI